MRELEFTIESKYDGKQARDFLRDFGVSSSLLTKLKQTENGITINGEFARAIDKISTGDKLKIKIVSKGHMPSPTKMNIEIVYEDEDIIVLNKPPLVPVHESLNHRGDTLSNFVSYHMLKQGQDTAFRAVFRLDRDTSGLVLVAKNELSASKLAGKISKDYYAVASGTISGSGTINKPIARCGESIIKRKVDENGENAITHYTPISTKCGNTLLKINLETGRTHQIRVHFESIGHPLLGDEMYGGDCSCIKRQALHCKDIYFIHPTSGKNMHITSDFPNDIKGVI
jgi:23S rRNA pseudouridine1911/1915/1917 synthase